ncbi:MAG: exo-alpha-sialidase [Chloroflexi bacterium]|nr:exo-alpha-sialidase [Chloroflexota bacterium]MCI0576674.1 exo-alpha-sialidase [Chloroflexota bacterium]MCI0647987.1 exo-alpha-sialidase [Chloroflexota bacterium]MCI0726803.1 exo-alpha-sialidase [Chloroflexota bacterium]
MSSNNWVLALVGTRKGAFIFESDEDRRTWQVHGPHFPGWSVHHLVHDARSGTLFAALDHAVYGSNVHRSADLGKSWEMAEGPSFPEGDERTVKRVWHIRPGHASQPGVVWAGADPGALFRSEDNGKSWSSVDGLNNHPTRENWFPGAGGMMVHTIIQDPNNPDRLFVAISAAGVFRSDDGGQSWQPKNKGVRADFLPDKYPEVGQCCHHLVMSPADPNVLFQQNHCGVYRSRDGGDNWEDIGTGRLPATFGFPMAVHPRHGHTIYVVPQVSDEYRFTPDGRFRVYRSSDGGEHWEGLTNGLPQDNAYLNVFREAMATDACDPAGVYVGTGTGQLFFSRDGGENWEALTQTLPPIYAVSTAVVSG